MQGAFWTHLARPSTPCARAHEHFEHLQNLANEGVVIFAGRTLTTNKESFGIVVPRTTSEEAAGEIMDKDWAVRHGAMTARLFRFRVVLSGTAPRGR